MAFTLLLSYVQSAILSLSHAAPTVLGCCRQPGKTPPLALLLSFLLLFIPASCTGLHRPQESQTFNRLKNELIFSSRSTPLPASFLAVMDSSVSSYPPILEFLSNSPDCLCCFFPHMHGQDLWTPALPQRPMTV